MNQQIPQHGPKAELTSHELSRIVDFLRQLRMPFDDQMPDAKPDVFWNIVLELVDAQLRDRPVDKSGLIALARVPYSTGNRMVTKMIADALIQQVPRGHGLKTHFLQPSERLLSAFMDYANHVKAHLAQTFGLRKGTEANEYYFGGSYFASQIISPIQTHDIGGSVPNDIRFLLNDDNYFTSMRNMWSDFRNDLGRKSSFDLQRLPDLYANALATGQSASPAHDVVSLNMPWLGEFAEKGLLAPLDELLTDAAINALDFHPSVWGTGNWNGTQYGIPLYCTIEILAARRDLFEDKGIAFPKTFDDTIRAARELHRPASELYGIAWNGQRGMPIANSFMFFLAACQKTVIDMPLHNQDRWRFDRFERLKLQIDTSDALEVIDYMKQLAEVSPPDIANMDWEKRISCFMSGQAGMAYCWTMRAARFEHELSSRVTRRVAYLSPPSRRMGKVAAPIGGFLMTIPANVNPARQRQIINAIAWMVSPEAMKAHVKNGFPVAPRFSVCADPEALASSPIVRMVDQMARRNELVTWSRPPVPAFNLIERTLGREIHDAVFGGKSPKQAIRDAENEILRGLSQ
ncbi:extracellular solute-binding protein [Loktanella sp. TSTF-M6]|uniref:Extracellular solute-binding protein n=1 Tax=Loktanella gaetbuli TaxID=2881335 RepID=A0ABS8BST1_9RHOB|nr:extracellular solute-binding protein [Loktanella gaetbuli]MCB5198793.1 extracellular solute-binding protein [Loktanella gaetbuli]